MIKSVPFMLAFITALFLFALPVSAAPSVAPSAQSTLPDFVLNAKTVISVTVAISGGQVIVVPVDLTLIAENRDGTTDVSIIPDVEQQAGIFIGVAPSKAISATLVLPQVAGSATPAAPQVAVAPGEGTHVVNRNANLRAGPGTNFEVVGYVRSGSAVTVVGQNNDGTWLELDNGNWIAEFLADPIQRDNNAPDNNNNNNDEDDAGADAGNDAGAEDVAIAGTINVSEQLQPVAAGQAALDSYLSQLATIGGSASDAVDNMTALMGNPDPLNQAWRDDAAAQLATLSGALDQYLALTPVPGYEALHTQVTEVALTCEQAVDYAVTGLDNPLAIDPALVVQSVQSCAAQADNLGAYVQTLQ